MSAEALSLPSATPRTAELDRIWQDLADLRQRPPETPRPEPCPEHLVFGASGNASPYQLWGWGHPENGFAWTILPEAFLGLPAAPAPGSLFLNARLDALLTAQTPVQNVQVYLGDCPVARWAVRTPGHYFALLPAALLDGPLRLRFVLPDAVSPRALGVSADERKLGLKFHDLWLTPWTNVTF